MKINLNDFKKLGICTKGLRVFCKHHGIDWSKAIRQGGIEVSTLREMGIEHPFLERVIASKTKES